MMLFCLVKFQVVLNLRSNGYDVEEILIYKAADFRYLELCPYNMCFNSLSQFIPRNPNTLLY